MFILYVDDEPTLLEMGKIFLETNSELSVDTITSAQEAFKLLAAKNYDAIISDFQMPEMNGIEFLKKVRATGNRIPFIIFTGRGREEIVIEALNNGADYYLQKGGDPGAMFTELAHIIQRAVLMRRTLLTLAEQEQRYHDIQNANDLIQSVDPAGHFLFVNKKWTDTLGYSEQELKNLTIFDIIHEESLQHCMEIFPRVISGEDVGIIEAAFRTRDGKKIYVEGLVTCQISDGKPLYTRGLFKDVTDRKKADRELLLRNDELRAAYEQMTAIEEELRGQFEELALSEQRIRESEEKYRTLFNNTTDEIYSHELMPDDSPGKFLEVNDIMCSKLGYTREELLTMSVRDIVSDAHRQKMNEIKKQFSGTEVSTFYGEHKKKDGTVFPVEITLRRIRFSGKNIVLAAARDITERKRAEDALYEREQKANLILQNANDAIFIHEISEEGPGRILDVNIQACQMLGYTREELLGMKIPDIDVQEQKARIPEILKTLFSHGNIVFQTEFIAKDGHRVPIEDSIRLIQLDGKPVVLCISRDLSKQKRAERDLDAANRKLHLLNSITRHDIRNNLTAFSGYLRLAKGISTDPKMASYIEKLESIQKSISEQIEFSSVYQDLGTTTPTWQDLHTLVTKLPFPKNLVLQNDIKDIAVYADPILEKVFFNLLDNTLRYGEHATMIRVSAQESPDGLILRWEDDGVGIPANEKEMIFKQGHGKNTGLGLFLSREILSITGMTIKECGEPGKGARFEILVPKEIYRSGGK